MTARVPHAERIALASALEVIACEWLRDTHALSEVVATHYGPASLVGRRAAKLRLFAATLRDECASFRAEFGVPGFERACALPSSAEHAARPPRKMSRQEHHLLGLRVKHLVDDVRGAILQTSRTCGKSAKLTGLLRRFDRRLQALRSELDNRAYADLGADADPGSYYYGPAHGSEFKEAV